MSEVNAKDTSLFLLVTSVFPAAKIFHISQIRQKTRWARILPRGGRRNDKAGNSGFRKLWPQAFVSLHLTSHFASKWFKDHKVEGWRKQKVNI